MMSVTLRNLILLCVVCKLNFNYWCYMYYNKLFTLRRNSDSPMPQSPSPRQSSAPPRQSSAPPRPPVLAPPRSASPPPKYNKKSRMLQTILMICSSLKLRSLLLRGMNPAHLVSILQLTYGGLLQSKELWHAWKSTRYN